ncbi:hypothetical protein ASD89_24115 [Caulobacter sp. Root656]|nr:hypothetical protein ASD89_24115 [Caulobacter sp. Root656]
MGARVYELRQEPVRRRLEDIIERAIAMLDALDSDPDLEDGHDREVCCEDEGWNDDREPDDNGLCTWQDEGSQATLRLLPSTPSRRPATARSPHQNVSGHIQVRVIRPG